MHDVVSNNKSNREDLLNLLKSINCSILTRGFQKSFGDYIYCSCDPELQYPICIECYEKCHTGHEVKFKKKMKTICSCGSKSHKIKKLHDGNINESMDNSNICPMIDWYKTINSEFIYVDKNTNKNICLFCINFCEFDLDSIVKRKMDLNNIYQICSCTDKKHYDSNIILKKLRNCLEPKNLFIENSSKTQFFNMIIKSKNSFDIIFKDLIIMIQKFTSKFDLLSSNRNNKLSQKFDLTETSISHTFNLYLNVLARLTEKCKRLNYFSSKIAHECNQKFIISLMNMSSDYKSEIVFNFKLNFLTLFINTNLKKDLSIVPNMHIKDIELLNPFQRLMYINNIKSQNEIMTKYINNLKFNFLEFTLKTLSFLNSLKNKFKEQFKLMRKLFYICKIYTKYNLFNYDQAIKYTNLIEDVIFNLSSLIKNFTEEGNSKISIYEEQIFLIKPIVKSLIYLSYYYNDQVSEKYFRIHNNNNKDYHTAKNLKFFNSNLELTKFISKNIINCLTDILNNPLNKKFYKEIRLVIFHISSIIKTFLCTRDSYSTGLKRIMSKNCSLYFDYVIDNLTTNESIFVNELRSITSELEKNFFNFFNFDITENDLNKNLKNFIKKFFDLMDLSNYRQADIITENLPYSFIEYESGVNKSINLNYLILSQGPVKYSVYPRQKTLNAIKRNEIFNGNLFDNSEKDVHDKIEGVNNFMKSNFDLIGIYKILVNKSFFLFSVVKIIKIYFNNHNEKRTDFKMIDNNDDDIDIRNNIEDNNEKIIANENVENLYMIEPSLFENILRVFYFYIENNEDNSVILLSSDFLETFVLLNNQQLNEILILVYIALKNIAKVKYELSNHYCILKFIKNVLKKINLQPKKFKNDFKIFVKILKLLKLVTRLNFINESLVSHNLRKFMLFIYDKFDIISEFVYFLKETDNKIQRSTNMKNITNSNHSNDNNNFDIENINIEEFQIHNKDNYKSNKNLKDNELYYNDDDYDLNEREVNGIKVKDASILLNHFLSLTNHLFDGDATLNKKDFLMSIMHIEDIFFILKQKKLDFGLRKEILKFFRVTYVNVILEKSKIENFLYTIVDKKISNHLDQSKPEPTGDIDFNDLYHFLNKLITINENTKNLDFEFEIIKNEMIIEEEILEINKYEKDLLKLEYLIEGIILPLKTYMQKLISKLNNFTGAEYLKLYELVYRFLNLKYKIITNEGLLNLLKTKYNFRDIFQISNLKTVEKLISLKKTYSEIEIEELKRDLIIMKNPNFEIYKYEYMIYIYNNHMNNLIISTKSESLKNEFLKKNIQFNSDKIHEIEDNLNRLNLLKTPYEKHAFNFIISYYNSKRDLSNSGFMNVLEDNNLQYSNSYRYLIIRSIFYILSNENYKEEYLKESFWSLFKLIQYDTDNVQKEILRLIEEPIDLVNLKNLNFLFLENLISIIFTGYNPTQSFLNNDYFLAINVVKLLKYLCENHNKDFQRIFFKEINLFENIQKFAINYQKEDAREITSNVILTDETYKINVPKYVKSPFFSTTKHNKISSFEMISKEENRIESENDKIQINNTLKELEYKNTINVNSENKFQINLKPFPNNNCTTYNSTYHQQDQLNYFSTQEEKLSTFELMLDVLNKIILIAQWNNVDYGMENPTVGYYYDIFSVIIEFLIEMIQGTEASNLESLLRKKRAKNDEADDFKIIIFFQNIKQILIRDDNDSIIVYQVRKDLIDFICAFLEEKSTPQKLINVITNLFNPYLIFNCLINIMKKLYLRMIQEANMKSNIKFRDVKYQDIKFDPNMGSFFEKKFFESKLSESPEFELSNRMYQFLKILATEYENSDALLIMNFINTSSIELKKHEVNLKNNLVNNDIKNKNIENNDSLYLIDVKENQKINNEIYNISIAEKYEVVKFFEKIIRTVTVQNKNQLVRVIFTINPLIIYISENTKNNFFQNVNRETRFIKLFSLMEYCDYFFDELIYNSKFSESYFMMNIFQNIKYYNLELFTFLITLIINILMLASLETGEEIVGDPSVTIIIEILAMINLCFCIFISLIWFYSRFPLYWIIDSKKQALKLNKEVENLNIMNKIQVFRNVIFLRNEVLAFIWHIIFCAAAYSNRNNHFLFSLEILIIVNLSSILKNIVKSLTLRYKQLIVTIFLFIVSNYQSGLFGFYFFSEDFYAKIWVLGEDGVIFLNFIKLVILKTYLTYF